MKRRGLWIAMTAALSLVACGEKRESTTKQPMTSTIITTSIAGNVAIFDTVAALKGIGTSSLDANSLYVLLGYYAKGDCDQGNLIWDPTSTATADDIFVFQPTAITGNGRFIRIEGGTFDARKGGLRVDGTTGQFAKLKAIYTACNQYQGVDLTTPHGPVIDTLSLGPGVIDVSDGGALEPGAGATKSIAIVGAGPLATTLRGNSHGSFAQQFGIWSTLAEPNGVTYGMHSWTQDLTETIPGMTAAGVSVFTGLSSVSGLSVGDWVLVRLGADPSDQGLPYMTLITQITNISGSDVTVAAPVREPIPSAMGINVYRTYNHHDMIKITNLFNGFELSNVALDNVIINPAVTLGTHIHDVYIPYSTAPFNTVYDENTVVERMTADVVEGRTGDYYGWFFAGWLHTNLVIRDLDLRLLHGVPFFSYEGQSRGMKIENVSVNIDSTNSAVGTVLMSIGAAEGPQMSNIRLTGYGTTVFDDHCTIDDLSVIGSEAQGTAHPMVDAFLTAGQVTGRLHYRGKTYDKIVQAPPMLIPVTPNSIIAAPFPLKGIPRHVRIRPSSLMGFTGLTQKSGLVETDLRSFLTVGQFTETSVSTVLGVNFPGGGPSDSQQIRIYTDATVPAGTYVEVESEFWVSSDDIDIQPPAQLAGAGAPSANADFIGQKYFDTTNSAFYLSVRTGTGSGDWVLTGP